jgi:hypothetical protein
MSWNLDTTALRITTAAAIRQSACGRVYRVRPGSSAVLVRLPTIARRIPAPKIAATNQNRSSSLPIRLDITPPQCRPIFRPRRPSGTSSLRIALETNSIRQVERKNIYLPVRVPFPLQRGPSEPCGSQGCFAFSFRGPRITLASLILSGNCSPVQLRPSGQLR